jgi:hypothetical protein
MMAHIEQRQMTTGAQCGQLLIHPGPSIGFLVAIAISALQQN